MDINDAQPDKPVAPTPPLSDNAMGWLAALFAVPLLLALWLALLGLLGLALDFLWRAWSFV